MLFKFVFIFALTSTQVFSLCLPKSPNRDLIFSNCMRCHSHKLICQQNMDRKTWDKTLIWMEKDHGLVISSKNDRDRILDYLTTYFGNNSITKKNPMGQRPTNPLPKVK